MLIIFRYELNRRFKSHFIAEHPSQEPDYTVLVHNHRVLFYTDQDGSTLVHPIPEVSEQEVKMEVKIEPELRKKEKRR